MTRVNIRRKGTQIYKKEGHVTMVAKKAIKAGTVEMAGNHQKLRERGGTDSPQRLQLYHYFDFGHLSSEL